MNRTGKGYFEKGKSGNPNGRTKGSQNTITIAIFDELLKAMKKTKKKEVISKGKSIIEHFVERAYKSDTVLCSFMKKIIPDKVYHKEDFENEDVKVTFEIVEASSTYKRRIKW